MNRLVTFLAGFSLGAVATAALSAAVVVVLLQSPSTEPLPSLAPTQQQATETIRPLRDSPTPSPPSQSYEPRTFPYDDPEAFDLCAQGVDISDQSERLDISEKGLLQALHELRLCGARLAIVLRDASGPPPSDGDIELGSASGENGGYTIEINALDPSQLGTFPIRCGPIRTLYGPGYNCTMLHELRHIWQFIYAAERPAFWLNIYGKEFDEEVAERDAEKWAWPQKHRVIYSTVPSLLG